MFYMYDTLINKSPYFDRFFASIYDGISSDILLGQQVSIASSLHVEVYYSNDYLQINIECVLRYFIPLNSILVLILHHPPHLSVANTTIYTSKFMLQDHNNYYEL